MDILGTLDIALGMAFVYLLCSLCVMAVNEFIAAVLSSRARWLRKGISALLTPPEAKSGEPRAGAAASDATTNTVSVADVYRSPFISALGRGDWKSLRFLPSYVPPWTLVQSMLDAANEASVSALGTFEEVKDAVKKLPDGSPVKVGLQDLMAQADNNLGILKTLVEEWFKTFENQVTAWYRQKTQYILVFLSLLLSVAINLDTLALVGVLSGDTAMRAALAEQAVKAAQSDSDAALLDLAPLTAAQDALARARATGGAAEQLRPLESKVDTELKALNDRARQLEDTLAATGLPIGWTELDFSHLTLGEQARKILGWLLTTFALSLGAPFWFDLLQKLSSIRSVGKNLLERKQADT